MFSRIRPIFKAIPQRCMSVTPKNSPPPKYSFQIPPALLATVVGASICGLIYYTSPPPEFYPAVGIAGGQTGQHPLQRRPAEIKRVVDAAEKREDTSSESKPKTVIEKAVEKTEQVVEKAEQVVATVKDEAEKAMDTVVESVENVVDDLLHEESHDSKLIKAQYVLVGGGTASYSAMKAIQEREPKADILIITDENYPPYMRPPLSKELWFAPDPTGLKFKDWGGTERSMVFQEIDLYRIEGSEELVVEKTDQTTTPARLMVGAKVVGMDAEAQTLLLDSGKRVKYGKVLLATGGSPKLVTPFSDLTDEIVTDKVLTFRTIEDLKRLNEAIKSGKTVAIVGGGFLGSELSCAMARYGTRFGSKIIQVFPEEGNMAQVFPKYLVDWTTEKVKGEGVNVLPGRQVETVSVTPDQQKIQMKLSDNSELECDVVVVAAGIKANDDFAREAGLEIDEVRGGIVVNSELEARTNVYVAGDLTSFHDMTLGRRRIEHHDHAVLSGRWAGRNMTGSPKPYKHQSMFWSDLGPSIGYEAVGIVDSTLPTIGLWAKATANDTPASAVKDETDVRIAKPEALPDNESFELKESKKHDTKLIVSKENSDEYGKGIIFYLKNDKVVGVLLWNMFHRTPIAQRVIREGKSVDDIREMAKLFKLHEE